ncbi:hypothetical protein LP7551_03575 [Roseibium album]|nr:hypothetical protein LP7551_03575 [Roseibium album]
MSPPQQLIETRSLAGRISPILIAAACLLGANGLSMTLISVRARAEGLPDTSIGLLGSLCFAGRIFGVVITH